MVNGLLRANAKINSNGMGLGNHGDATGGCCFIGRQAALFLIWWLMVTIVCGLFISDSVHVDVADESNIMGLSLFLSCEWHLHLMSGKKMCVTNIKNSKIFFQVCHIGRLSNSTLPQNSKSAVLADFGFILIPTHKSVQHLKRNIRFGWHRASSSFSR